MQRSSYPGQRDSERDRIESFYQLIAGILRRTLRVDGSPASRAGDDAQAEDRDTFGPRSDEEEQT